MPEEKKPKLPPFKEFMELYYGKKLHDPTPEELEETRRGLEAYQKRKMEEKRLKDGQQGT